MSACRPSLSVCASKYPVQCSKDYDGPKEYLNSMVFTVDSYNNRAHNPNTSTFRTIITSDRFTNLLPNTKYLLKVGYQLVGDGKSGNSSNWKWRLTDDGNSIISAFPPLNAVLVSKERELDNDTASIESVSWVIETSEAVPNWRISFTFKGRSDSLLTDESVYCQVFRLPA
jgi:hypothetical protein